MKQAFIIGVFLLICALVVSTAMPQATVAADLDKLETVTDQLPQPEALAVFAPAQTEVSPVPPTVFDGAVKIKVLFGDETKEMPLDEYLAGVVAAEMPASFEPEALKAQAVAARTNVTRKLEYGSKHENADVCADCTCCMGWREPDNEAFALAVAETDGQVVSYEGTIIDAVFFSSSWGETEDAVAVWGSDVPYLTSVKSPETQVRTETVNVPLTELCLAVREISETADFSGDWIRDIEHTQSGAVKSAVIGGTKLTGSEIRKLFGLRSACFDVELTASGARFTTYGYGHGVGMSQYGANAMAESGSGYKDILTWYYTGCQVETPEISGQ